jgi:hypothetical protein
MNIFCLAPPPFLLYSSLRDGELVIFISFARILGLFECPLYF